MQHIQLNIKKKKKRISSNLSIYLDRNFISFYCSVLMYIIQKASDMSVKNLG